MLARIVLVFSLSLILTALALVGYLLTSPRARLQVVQTHSAAADSELDDAPTSQREIEVPDPLDLLDRLPTTLKPNLNEAASAADASRNDSAGSSGGEDPAASDAPRLLPAAPTRRLDAAIAPNRPGALQQSGSAVVQASAIESSHVMTVMHALHDPSLAVAARNKLMALGFAPNHIELARQFTDSDAGQRIDAVRSLPSIRGIVARDWFLWASRDVDAGVRRAALALMATSGQSELLARVDEMSTDDTDAEVRDSARRSVERLRQRSR